MQQTRATPSPERRARGFLSIGLGHRFRFVVRINHMPGSPIIAQRQETHVHAIANDAMEQSPDNQSEARPGDEDRDHEDHASCRSRSTQSWRWFGLRRETLTHRAEGSRLEAKTALRGSLLRAISQRSHRNRMNSGHRIAYRPTRLRARAAHWSRKDQPSGSAFSEASPEDSS
jgi:hypothetical protein